ncbi:uncharacterized protein MYCFIDRAFT_211515 [Pseudocercospora fijiensis CIRAD86]|uniref:Apple domain-containing protein n=1 Tax=Pseudocercospora fijiensis (strain CIRAD86) TaxID=383855 RepID=M3AXX1_PSEFD|nr:uncharacterized protein MYCFIDRAFT_211515 [Pseudocercospora fijiensis CIRAD86]EME81988.1 hypothetical protein MYCFIDRAFT_211515 [Pseudocercospora fijiensis CIRAD86]
MQLIDFALIGLAIAAPTTQVRSAKEATTCPGVNGAQTSSNNNVAYRIECAKWVDSDEVLRITTTEVGYEGCLTACDGTIDCGIAQFIATDDAQIKGFCTLFKKGAAVKQGSSNSWTLATQIDSKPAPGNPTVPVPGDGDKFGLIVVKPGSPIHHQGITASHGSLLVGGKQDATCDTKSDFATFFINNGEAYLYSPSSTQQLWVDRSGMGQGISGYTTGTQEAPKNAERKSFKVDKDGHLTFEGVTPKACPGKDNDAGWSLWFSSADKPGFNEGCIGVALKALKEDNPVSCSYTGSS